jgi:hypothetical protein
MVATNTAVINVCAKEICMHAWVHRGDMTRRQQAISPAHLTTCTDLHMKPRASVRAGLRLGDFASASHDVTFP